MLGELVREITGAVSELRHGTATETLTFAKPWCTPSRGIIEPVLAKYGVKVYGFSESAKMANPLMVLKMTAKIPGDLPFPLPNALPIAQVAEITVSKDAAGWAEYLLLRTGKLYRVGGYINRRNERWAARHGGQMPPAWDNGTPWIETACSDGVEAWQEVKKAANSK